MTDAAILDRPATISVEDRPEDGPVAPRISVGIPVYNGEAYLPAALDALLAQDVEDFEIIISDNASTDGTEAICRAYAARDPRIRYYRSDENRGAAWNFNEVVRLARGEYFRWACHDDLCEPEHLRRCVALLDMSPPSVILAYARTLLIDESGHTIGVSNDDLDTQGLPPHRRFQVVAQRLRYANVLFGVHRRDALLQTELIGPYESSDYVLLAHLSLLGEFAEVPAYLFRRRIHPGMSRQANRTPRTIARWFAPSTGAWRFYAPQARLQLGYARVVLRAPLSRGERARAMLALRFWIRRGLKPLLRETLAAFAPDRAYQ